MNKKRIVSAVLCALMFFSFTTFALSAEQKVSLDDWKDYYKTVDNTLISLTPGTDESELNFNWHSDFTLSKPIVRISTNKDMSDYKEFEGYSFPSHVAGQRTNRVTATGFTENETYYYTYSTGKGFSEPCEYTTRSADSFKFLYVSDQQPKHDEFDLSENSFKWNTVLETAFNNNDDISFIVSAGDMTNSGTVESEWTATLSPKYLRSFPLATVVGNHDNKGITYKYYVNNPNTYLGLWPSITGNGYWFRYGDVLFVMINSCKINTHDTYKLIDKAVDANPDAKWRIGVMHHDVYGTGRHAGQEETIKVRKTVIPAFESHDFDVILTGHDHIYGRSYFMKNGQIVENSDYNSGVVTNPEGILYMTASASSGITRTVEESYNYPWISYECITGNDSYSTVEITDDGKLLLETVDTVTNEIIDKFTIVKTDFSFEYEDIGGYFKGIIIPYLCEKYPILSKLFNL